MNKNVDFLNDHSKYKNDKTVLENTDHIKTRKSIEMAKSELFCNFDIPTIFLKQYCKAKNK